MEKRDLGLHLENEEERYRFGGWINRYVNLDWNLKIKKTLGLCLRMRKKGKKTMKVSGFVFEMEEKKETFKDKIPLQLNCWILCLTILIQVNDDFG